MSNFKIAAAVAIAMCDAGVDKIDDGSAAGTIAIYDGTQPTGGPDEAIGSQTKLAELTFSDPAFGNAADDNPGGKATANSITDASSADADGTAAWFRIFDSNGVAKMDGDVGTSGADLNLNTVSITAGSTVSITSAEMTMPES